MKHKNKIILSSISILIVVLTLLLLSFNKHKNVLEVNNGSIAIMLETEPGVYTKSQSNNWPSENDYIFDSEKSYCSHGGTLIWKMTTMYIESKGNDKCYAYFKSISSVSEKIGERILEFNGGKTSIESKDAPDFINNATTNEGMYATADDYGTSYYFRGAVDNNWVYFAGFYWRIIRVNGDGSVKLIYSGPTAPTSSESVIMTGTITQTGNSVFNSLANSGEYAGYMYTVGKHRGYANSSVVKTNLDNWYTNNLKDYEAHLSDFVICNDRGYESEFKPIGLFEDTMYSNMYRRVFTNHNPHLICSNKEDAYTVKDVEKGNGKLTNPIGLITGDEIAMAGVRAGTSYPNSSFYLFNGQAYWTISPTTISSTSAFVLRTIADGAIANRAVNGSLGVRPVISLKANTSVIGSGKWNDPYKIPTFADKILANNGGKHYIENRTNPNFNNIADTNEGMFKMADTYGTSYYFRGAVDNNWVLFADYYWRIVRINGDGSIRLIYSGTTAPTEEEKVIIPEDKASYMNCLNTCGNTYSYKRLNEKAACIDDCYTSKTSIGISNFNPAGYHGTNGEQLDFRAEYIGYKYTLNQHRGYNVDSYAKTYLDNWFENNLQNFDEYLSDSIFCNDRSFTAAGYTPVGDPPEGTSSGSDVLNRLRNVSPPNPILTCPHKDDRFTVNDTTLGNGRLDYKVGLLTADETAVAGSEFKTDNFNCYLHSLVPYWLMSPIDVSKGYMPMHYVMASASMHVGIDGSLSSQLVPDAAAFRPVISLNSDISVTGSGLWNDPYFVVGSTVGDTGHQPDTS